MRIELYQLLVNKVPSIQKKYHERRQQVSGIGRVGCWMYLLKMNYDWYVLRKREDDVIGSASYYENNKLYSAGSESALSMHFPPKKLAARLMKYQVITFDVFDTLIFRPFSSPADLFYLMGDALAYPDFKRIRQEMERKAREIHHKEKGDWEVSLEEIYALLSEETGIDREQGMAVELAMEEKMCFANPYMLEVIRYLKAHGKGYQVISDMYLGEARVRHLLKTTGYPEPENVYVSCDYGMSKGTGTLYSVLPSLPENSWIHIGDNVYSDIEQAKKHGAQVYHYPNVNEVGEKYRSHDMSAITGSIYRGLVNAHIHNGLHQYSRSYEYGYIYGGLMITGYCSFIHNYVQKHHVDKILFLARDGDILKKAWQILYPEEADKTEYVYWSRIAAAKMTADKYKYDYFRRFLDHKVNQQYNMAQIMKSMELEDMLVSMCHETDLKAQSLLTDKNVLSVRAFLKKHWDEVTAHYREQLEAGRKYFEPILKNCRHAAAVDIGWAGSGAIALRYLVKEVWQMDCELTGIIAGSNTFNNAEPDASETFLQRGQLVSYMYSQQDNRDLWRFHNPGRNHNLYLEAFMDAESGTFRGFYPGEDGTVRLEFGKPSANGEHIRRIQKGILDFVRQYKAVNQQTNGLFKISGRDAYAPMISAEQEDNKAFMQFIEEMLDEVNVV